MTIGIGTSSIPAALESLSLMTEGVSPIAKSEFETRIRQAQSKLRELGGGTLYLHAGSSMFYFTGLRWSPSERMVAALIPAEGELKYVAPKFELNTLQDYWLIEGELCAWEEHEDPVALVDKTLASFQNSADQLFVDPATPFFLGKRMLDHCCSGQVHNGQALIDSIRGRKSAAEIALIQRSHEMTLAVIKAAASILRPGIKTTEVVDFLNQAHQKVGAAGSSFAIALFGVATSFPHGVKEPQLLGENDWVLIDTGCLLEGYHSDITRTFPFGEPTDQQRKDWDVERAAQLAAFANAQLGQPCEAVDQAARRTLEQAGFGPDYQLPGLPHRTGHGCGLDIHEWPYMVRGESTPLDVGMVASIEPMLVVPDRYGIRLEDHFYMTDSGPRWFTQPSPSIDAPFGEETS